MDPSSKRHPPHYLTTEEAAEFLRLAPGTLNKQRVYGGGPQFHRFGRRIRYALADLQAWADARACGATFDPAYLKLKESEEKHE